jgi:protein-S-isoprenylcysteine O-methyltransferase Ste14/rhodanese-related sulfurtransferase
LLNYIEWLGVNQSFMAVTYLLAAATGAAIWLTTGLAAQELTFWGGAALVVLAPSSIFLLIFSLSGLITYFAFIPSIKDDSHIFAQVHGTLMIHPLTTAVVLGLACLCVLTGSVAGWAVWFVTFVVYLAQTASIIRTLRRENEANGSSFSNENLALQALNLVLGGEIVTVAGGAKPMAPWRLNSLPENTWIVDVRTKSEFQWNRMANAENYPWGLGLTEAAAKKPKDIPILVTCLSGHRSPAVAVTLRRMGFKTVYNLNWGLLYLMLLERGRKGAGPFGMTRSHRDANMRGKDFRGISIGYITCALLTLIIAPIENSVNHYHVPVAQTIIGALVGLGGLALGLLSFKALGRNFRVFAAPRRSGTLITTGVYSKIRHPMYIAVIAAVGGYALAFSSLYSIPFWIGCAVFYCLKAVKEEQLLLAKYPEYAEYRYRTWRLIPYIW